jgi:hypothetical protein
MMEPPSEEAADLSASTTDSTPPALRPIRVGARVTSTNATPTFASDPQPGARGVVVQAAGADGAGAESYLVRWDGGAEGWSKREHLEPSGRSALAPSTAAPQGSGTTGPPRRPAGPGARNIQRFLPLLFVVFAGQGLIRAFVRSARHPSASTALIALLILAVAGLTVRRILRRGGPSSTTRRPRGPGSGSS